MEETTQEFSARLGSAAQQMTMMQMLYVAHRLDLFQTMREMGPSTIQAIAGQMRLRTRYLRELVSSLYCHNVLARTSPADQMVESYMEDAGLYHVPQKTVDTLLSTRHNADSQGWMAWPIFLNVGQHAIDGVVEAFHETARTRGVSFDDFRPEIVEALDLMSSPGMRTDLMQLIKLSPTLMSALQGARRVLDVGCGSGTAVLVLAKQFPECQFTGVDISQSSIARATANLLASGLQNATFQVQDIAALDGQWDVITTFDVIHDIPQSTEAVRLIHQALKKGGTYLMVEPGVQSRVEDNVNPRGGFLYGVSLLHCLTQNLALDGEGLGAAWGTERQRALLERAGFNKERIEKLDLSSLGEGKVPNYWICTK